MRQFVIVRLGKDSVQDIRRIDAVREPTDPLQLSVRCAQVPLDVEQGFYAFLYLGSDNSKGVPTEWKQGLRALGVIEAKSGGKRYADTCVIEIEVRVIFPESYGKEDFVRKAPSAYCNFSAMPIIGLSSYSNQTVQLIKTAESSQDIGAFFKAIEVAYPDFRAQIEKNYPELSDLFAAELPSLRGTDLNQDVTSPLNEPEGLDTETSGSGWGRDYPLDSVFVRKDQRTVIEIMRRMDNGRYILDPDFQRDFVWPPLKQSRLIESCLMRIPLPVFYVAEAKDGKIIVVDGLQRLTTFHRYINNKFALTGLGGARTERSADHPLLNKKYEELPLSLKERLEDTQLTLYILDSKAPERAKLDIFERVNGGVPLTRQQMRNCLFVGEATKWLKNSAGSASFIAATGKSLDSKSMRDREAINRFCAFRLLGCELYRGDMDDFLASALKQMNAFSSEKLAVLTKEFDRAMKSNHFLFGKHAFRKSLVDLMEYRHAVRTVINIALFDVCSVYFAALEESSVDERAAELRASISALIKNEDFRQSITYSTNGVPQVTTRFRMMKEAIDEVI